MYYSNQHPVRPPASGEGEKRRASKMQLKVDAMDIERVKSIMQEIEERERGWRPLVCDGVVPRLHPRVGRSDFDRFFRGW